MRSVPDITYATKVNLDIRHTAVALNTVAITPLLLARRLPGPKGAQVFVKVAAGIAAWGMLPETRYATRTHILPPVFTATGDTKALKALAKINKNLDGPARR